ncbi:MAG: sulfite exporter TauE/SafE family protein [Saprospiraceae bacterium]|nr:sulfite exporter TauE/SafE family protein [Candidatus Vicinibacter affinis]MBP7307511.1 sulfite exporter TauE/SafE family protein [Saprospiraceae bacterium]MBK6571929.1 sulfite exporter TauE/SafE family protein [Candidatus Vicinibacter affinis]MBK7305285.1 sulfite exporter TauE/SafE family protein [Candidatus Vicinibacter affinis]MBK7693663.1 sulfite exporter TauE/SafE family protein [Candidatus Vicinibacter affinis]
MVVFLISALTLGLGSSLHCMGMCGPLVMAMPFQDLNGDVSTYRLIMYHVGKTLSYAFLGFILGSFGMGFKLLGYQQGFSLFFGVSILIISLFPYITKSTRTYQNKLFGNLSQISASLLKRSGKNSIFYLGVANGLIPCGIVYIALAASVLMYSSLKASVFMMIFGLATIPSLSIIIYSKRLITSSFGKNFKTMSLVFSLTLSMLFIMRGMNLGIPYLSPKLAENSTLNCCHKK